MPVETPPLKLDPGLRRNERSWFFPLTPNPGYTKP